MLIESQGCLSCCLEPFGDGALVSWKYLAVTSAATVKTKQRVGYQW